MAVTHFEFTDNSNLFIEEAEKAAKRALEGVGLHLEGEAKEELNNSPRRIDTGLLRNSITHAAGGKQPAITSYHGDHESRYGFTKGVPSGSYHGTMPGDKKGEYTMYIGTNVEYAPYIHEGTQRLAPNRFLKNACMRNQDQIEAYIKKAMKGS